MTAIGGLSLLGLWVWFFWLYRDYRVDAYRQRVFALRNELWDYAAAGHISFDDPAYLVVRNRMNGLIRFAHLLSLTWLLVAAAARALRPVPELETEAVRELEEALKKVDTRVAERIRSLYQQALLGAAEHIILMSPIFWMLVIPIVLVALIRLAWIQSSQLLNRFPTDLVDSEAARLGGLA